MDGLGQSLSTAARPLEEEPKGFAFVDDAFVPPFLVLISDEPQQP